MKRPPSVFIRRPCRDQVELVIAEDGKLRVIKLSINQVREITRQLVQALIDTSSTLDK